MNYRIQLSRSGNGSSQGGIILFFVLCIFGVFGIFMIYAGKASLKDMSYKKNHYSSTTGHICDYVKEKSTVRRNGRRRTETTYFPIYEYSVDGVTYQIKGATGSSVHPRVGKLVTIYYNPNNPEDAVAEGDEKGAKLFIWLGIVFLMVGVIGIFGTIKGKMKKKTVIHSYTEKGIGTNGGYNPYGTYIQSGGYNPYSANNTSSGYNPYNTNNTSNGYNPYNMNNTSSGYNPYNTNNTLGGYNPYNTNNTLGGYNPYNANNTSDGYNPYSTYTQSNEYEPYSTYTQSNEYDPYPQKKQKSLEDFPNMHNDIG